MTPAEEWRSIPGYDGLYEVSSLGRVRSLDRTVSYGPGDTRSYVGRDRRLTLNYGYLKVALYKDGRRAIIPVHHLVAEAFLGPRPPGLLVLHWNDVKIDNRAANLRYGTRSDNQEDSVRNGAHGLAARTHCKNGHMFTPDNTGPLTGRPGRRCRRCAAESARRRREAKKARSA